MLLQTSQKTILNKVLKKISESLDLTLTQYEDATSHYKAVGTFLGDCPVISQFNPQIFPQGSFRLGTVVRPIFKADEYDIDLVCQLESSHNQFTQYQLKKIIGDRLKQPMYKDKLLPEKRRCWTLKYAESTKFHLDVLPAIPDKKSREYLYGLGRPETQNKAISITDNEEGNYYNITDDWTKSNPKGYADWFKNQMIIQLNERRKSFAGLNGVNVDEVPYYKVKTPLQRAIQILKRHRDNLFGDDEDKPISIIITTLSARSYRNEDNIQDALLSILRNMTSHIKKDLFGNDVIENPVDPRENFADKWEKYPKRKKNFYSWLEKAKIDFDFISTRVDLNEVKESLKSSLGDNTVNKVFDSLNENQMNASLILSNNLPVDYAPNEQFIKSMYPVIEYNSMQLGCKVNRNGFREYDLNKYPLYKGSKLKFHIRHNVSQPYDVKWKVRNRGKVAKNHSLRGQIIDDAGFETLHETADFFGLHFVECYIIKNGTCVAQSRIDVPISGSYN